MPDSLCERFHKELLWCFREHHSRGVVMHLALLIGGEAVMSLGVKDVPHTGFKLAAHNYGNVMDVSHLGKNSDRHPIQGDSEMKMRGSQLLVSWHCVVVRGSEAIPLLPEPPPRDRHLVFGRADAIATRQVFSCLPRILTRFAKPDSLPSLEELKRF